MMRNATAAEALENILGLLLWALLFFAGSWTATGQSLDDRVEGLLVGSLVGDAVGAPTEFATPIRSPWTSPDSVLSPQGRKALGALFQIGDTKRQPDPYGPWTQRPGALTDDSRFKIVFFDHLSREGRISGDGFAREILAWERGDNDQFQRLRTEWLLEFRLPARWVLGDSASGLPPERAWGGIATMAGQMPFLPIAALTSTPVDAYRLTWDVDFLDNGIGRDITAGLVAGLNAALAEGADWTSVETAMRQTDPWGFDRVPWVQRRMTRWLDVAAEIAREARGQPAALFELLESRLGAETWWEAWVPLVVVFATARMTEGDPLVTMQIILEFGHDTDSYLQLAGAFFGALHGKQVFPLPLRTTVQERLGDEYGDSVDRWMELIHLYRDR
ncbi:MAG: ADP-ribosylglycohydrolase [Thalassolituus oleivorans]|jgi:ADP-ribosylglycohydrolase